MLFSICLIGRGTYFAQKDWAEGKLDMLETTAHIMRVKKRDGTLEAVDVTKIVERVTKNCQGLTQVDPLRVATKAISGLYDGASTKELDNLCIQTASLLIGEDPEYSRLASRLLSIYIDEEVRSQKIQSFADSVAFGYQMVF